MSTSMNVEKRLLMLEDRTSTTFDERTLRDMLAAMGDEEIRIVPSVWPWKLYLKVAAIAAALLVTMMLARNWLSPSDPVKVVGPNRVDTPFDRLDQERLRAESYLAQNNHVELRLLLKSGLPETQMLVADMLARLGDRESLETLRSQAADWSGDPEVNPFQQAIDRLMALDPNEPPGAPNDLRPDANQAGHVMIPGSNTGIAGIVVDELTGEPIVGAEVFRRFFNPEGVFTDTRGAFLLTGFSPPQRPHVYVTAAGYVTKRLVNRIEEGQITRDLRIALGRASKVAGSVMDIAGKPLAEAEVSVSPFTRRSMTTDTQGQFLVDGLNPLVDAYTLHVRHPNYPSLQMQVSPGAVGETVYVEPILQPGVTVTGRITDMAGSPLEGVRVGCKTEGFGSSSIQSKTDAQGQYLLKNVHAGDLSCWAVKPGYAPSVTKLERTEAPAIQRVDIQMADTTPLHGRVVDQSGLPIAGAGVVVDAYEGVRHMDCRQATTDNNGHFVLPDAPDRGSLRLWVYGQGVSGRGFKVDWTQDPLVLQVTRSGRIYGRVVDARTDRPIQIFTVKLSFSQVERSPGGLSATWLSEGHTYQHDRGEFDTGDEDIPVGGAFRMTVFAEGYDRLTVDPIQVHAITNDPNRVLFRLHPATALAGRVVDPEGRPVANASVGVFSDTMRWEPANWTRFSTDEQGIFVLTGLGEDQRYLHISASGFADHLCYRSDLIDRQQGSVDVVLSPGATLFGLVTDRSGQPQAGIPVSAFLRNQTHGLDSGWAIKYARTDQKGAYILSNLPAGSLSLSFREGSGPLSFATIPCSVSPGESRELNLDLNQGFVLNGTVLEQHVPQAGATVAFEMEKGATLRARTDSTGNYEIAGISGGLGTLRVKYTEDLNEDYLQRLTVDRDRTVDVQLEGLILRGRLPVALRDQTHLSLVIRRWSEDVEPELGIEGRWINDQRARRAVEISSDGHYSCGRLQPGRFYLILRQDGRTQAITEEFELDASLAVMEPVFKTETGALGVRVLDARTHEPIDDVTCSVSNECQWSCGQASMDDRKELHFPELILGRYRVHASAPKSLASHYKSNNCNCL